MTPPIGMQSRENTTPSAKNHARVQARRTPRADVSARLPARRPCSIVDPNSDTVDPRAEHRESSSDRPPTPALAAPPRTPADSPCSETATLRGPRRPVMSCPWRARPSVRIRGPAPDDSQGRRRRSSCWSRSCVRRSFAAGPYRARRSSRCWRSRTRPRWFRCPPVPVGGRRRCWRSGARAHGDRSHGCRSTRTTTTRSSC